jgi:carboxypeptidase C (cathepsin A)
MCALALAAVPAAAQGPPSETPRNANKAGKEAELLPDEPVVTQHTARINGQSVRYTAEAGWLPIREDGKLMARMFYVAYTRDGVTDLAARPLVFSFNGGPGTASVWMHMGYTGPRRVVYDDDGFALRPPGGLEDNPQSILDVADIVYIDPIATGFSRMAEGEDLHKYHGTLSDVESVAEFIRLYILRKNRWMSPKFLIGESYGTTRASGLAGHLVRAHQIYLNATSRTPRRSPTSRPRRGTTGSSPPISSRARSGHFWTTWSGSRWGSTWRRWCRVIAWTTRPAARWPGV